MTAKHRRVTKNTHGSRMTAGVLTALAMASSNISITNAAPKVVTQPGTQEQHTDPAPAQQAPPQVVQSTPIQRVEVVRYVPGAPQAVQPVIVKNVITKKVVYETSPGMVLLSPGGSRVLNPINVAETFRKNIRKEDRGTLEAASGAAAAGAVTGAAAGTVLGAVGGGAAGAALGFGAGAVICSGITAAVPAAPLVMAGQAAACWLVVDKVGAYTGAVSGATLGAVLGAPTGTLAGAQLGASSVPGGRAALDRTIADTTWDLESQARVSQGAEPLAGKKPGDSMPSAMEAAKHTAPGLPVIADNESVESAVTSSAIQLPSINASNLQLPNLSVGLPPIA